MSRVGRHGTDRTIATPSGRRPLQFVQILVGTTLSIVRLRKKTPRLLAGEGLIPFTIIAGWVCRNRTEYPYPQGAPVNMPPKEDGIEKHEKEPTGEDVMSEDAPVVVIEDPPSDVQVDTAAEDAVVEDAATVVVPEDPPSEDAGPENAPMVVPEDPPSEDPPSEDAAPEDAPMVALEDPPSDVPVDTMVEDAAVEDAVPMVVPEGPPSEDAPEGAPMVVLDDSRAKDAVPEDAMADYTVLEDADAVMDNDSWKRPLLLWRVW